MRKLSCFPDKLLLIFIMMLAIGVVYTQNLSLRYSIHYLQTDINDDSQYTFWGDFSGYNIGVEFVNKFKEEKKIPIYFSMGLNNNIVKARNFSISTLQIPLFVNAEFGKKVKGDIGVGFAYSYVFAIKDKTPFDFYKDLINKHTIHIIYRAGIKYNIKNGHYLGVNIKMSQSLSPQYKIQRTNPIGISTGEVIFKSYYTGIGIFYEMPINIKKKQENESN